MSEHAPETHMFCPVKQVIVKQYKLLALSKIVSGLGSKHTITRRKEWSVPLDYRNDPL